MLELRLLPIVRFLLFILTNRYFFKQKKVTRTKCLVLYSFNFNRDDSILLLEKLDEYFKNKHEVQFEYAGLYDETYKINYGSYDAIKSKIIIQHPAGIVNFALDLENPQDKKS